MSGILLECLGNKLAGSRLSKQASVRSAGQTLSLSLNAHCWGSLSEALGQLETGVSKSDATDSRSLECVLFELWEFICSVRADAKCRSARSVCSGVA